jgi:hypothetical protein
MGLRDRPRLRRAALLGIILHALFLVVADFEHHDIICHLKTPQHCTSCSLNSVGSEARHDPVTGAWSLSDAGRAVASHDVAQSVLLPVRSSSRAPPASA